MEATTEREEYLYRVRCDAGSTRKSRAPLLYPGVRQAQPEKEAMDTANTGGSLCFRWQYPGGYLTPGGRTKRKHA